MSFCLGQGRATAGSGIVSPWGKTQFVFRLLLSRLPFVKHWEIIEGDYTLAPNDVEATWFIDPPYCQQSRYVSGKDINYKDLGKWCHSRKGQVIVCESQGANWLPFQEFVLNKSSQRQTSKLREEVMYYQVNGKQLSDKPRWKKLA